MESSAYDYVIVGGGTAGLVLATRLSEDPTTKVVVLEAGEDQTNDPRVTTPALWPMLLGTTSDWVEQTAPQTELDGRRIAIPQGRLLGGSSGLNGLAFTATSKANIDAWAKLGNPGWDWSTLVQYLKKSYTLTKPSARAIKQFRLEYLEHDKSQTTNGPIQLSFPEDPDNVWPRAWIDTLTNLGFSKSGDPFSGEACGAYINTETVHPITRQRSFGANDYLKTTKGRSNLTIITGAVVEKVILDSSNPNDISATGVQYRKDEKVYASYAEKDVILCAGAINSPRLLEISGLGAAEILREHGVDVLVDNPNIGENLQNHILCGLSFEVDDQLKTMDALVRQESAAVKAATEAYAGQSGPFTNSGTFASAMLPLFNEPSQEQKREIERLLDAHKNLLRSKFDIAHEKFVRSVLSSSVDGSGCFICFPGYVAHNPDGSMAQPPPGASKYFSIAVLLAHPLSRGSSHISSNLSTAKPRIDPRYLSHQLDLEFLARHVHYANTNIVNTEPLMSLLKPYGKRSLEQPSAQGDLSVVRDFVRRTVVGAHHYTGTCSMMPREMGGVVDPHLKVYGCRKLRVCDASIMPITTNRNPQATVYAIAEYAADLIKKSA